MSTHKKTRFRPKVISYSQYERRTLVERLVDIPEDVAWYLIDGRDSGLLPIAAAFLGALFLAGVVIQVVLLIGRAH